MPHENSVLGAEGRPSEVTMKPFDVSGFLFRAEKEIFGIIINPEAPPQWGVEHCERDRLEIFRWWQRPYVHSLDEGYEVLCLDGKVSGRPTVIGFCSGLVDAVMIAFHATTDRREAKERFEDDLKVALVRRHADSAA